VIPNEASRELARVAALVRSTGRRIALWRGAVAGIPLLAILVATGLLPREWMARPGSFLPMALASLGLSTFAAAGLVAGFSMRANRLRRVVPEIEAARGLARGDLLGAIELDEQGGEGAGLASLHRARVAGALRGRSARDLLPGSVERLRATRRIAIPGFGVVLTVLAVGLLGGRGSGQSILATLARPWSVTFPPPPPPLRISPPGGEVLRGTALDIVVTASGRTRVLLAQSLSGTPTRWDTVSVVNGVAAVRIHPVEEVIRFWARDEKGSVTDTFSVVPLDPLTVTALQVELDYPPYLGRTRDVVSGYVTRLDVPAGTKLGLTARTNHPIRHMGLVRQRAGGTDTVSLEIDTDRATGSVVATDSATLSWSLVPREQVPGLRAPPAIVLSVRADEAPTVSVRYPGEDTLLGLAQALSLVIEARDDHGLAEVGVAWWRESTGGRSDPPVYERLSGSAGRRLLLRPTIDLEAAGFLPGDEIVYYATARDSRPGSEAVVSDTFRARLSALDELRDEWAHQAEELVEETRSIRERAGDLSDEAQDAGRRISARSLEAQQAEAADRADFGATREARDLLGEAREIESDLERLREELGQARSGLESSPLLDTDLQERLGELEALFQEILQSGLRERIEALEQSLRGLDRGELHSALAEFARQSRDLEERLDRALGLMERVALEQSLESARQTAEDLAARQERMAASDLADEEWAERQEEVAAEAEALSDRVDELADRLDGQQAPDAADRGREAADQARAAASRMRSAAGNVGERPSESRPAPGREAEEAASAMESAERSLAIASETLTEDWQAEAMQVVSRATAETLELAKEQERVLENLRSGEPPEELSGRQAAVREGLDNISQSLAEAGRKTALMDRRAGPAAARAGREMDALGESLSGGAARKSEAMRQGEAAMEALGDLAGSLMASRREMAEATSATGMEEALERLAGMGKQQAGLNSESGELFMFMQGGQSIEDRLGSLAARQDAVSEDLRDLAGDPAARELGARPAELASEADEIARRLAAGSLDRETLARQEQLFRQLLDAGRSLEKDERDANRREATTARPRLTLRPDGGTVEEASPRYPYPEEGQLEGLTASQRRLVYEYFDRLNGAPPGDRP
jgi:hypothetical protein